MNYFNKAEKTLKSCLKEKLSITTATVVGFLIAGTVAFGINVNGETNEDCHHIKLVQTEDITDGIEIKSNQKTATSVTATASGESVEINQDLTAKAKDNSWLLTASATGDNSLNVNIAEGVTLNGDNLSRTTLNLYGNTTTTNNGTIEQAQNGWAAVTVAAVDSTEAKFTNNGTVDGAMNIEGNVTLTNTGKITGDIYSDNTYNNTNAKIVLSGKSDINSIKLQLKDGKGTGTLEIKDNTDTIEELTGLSKIKIENSTITVKGGNIIADTVESAGIVDVTNSNLDTAMNITGTNSNDVPTNSELINNYGTKEGTYNLINRGNLTSDKVQNGIYTNAGSKVTMNVTNEGNVTVGNGTKWVTGLNGKFDSGVENASITITNDGNIVVKNGAGIDITNAGADSNKGLAINGKNGYIIVDGFGVGVLADGKGVEGVNNGTIVMKNSAKSSDSKLTYGMQAKNGASVINNGTIALDYNTTVREGNNRVVMALGTEGEGSTATNNGKIKLNDIVKGEATSSWDKDTILGELGVTGEVKGGMVVDKYGVNIFDSATEDEIGLDGGEATVAELEEKVTGNNSTGIVISSAGGTIKASNSTEGQADSLSVDYMNVNGVLDIVAGDNSANEVKIGDTVINLDVNGQIAVNQGATLSLKGGVVNGSTEKEEGVNDINIASGSTLVLDGTTVNANIGNSKNEAVVSFLVGETTPDVKVVGEVNYKGTIDVSNIQVGNDTADAGRVNKFIVSSDSIIGTKAVEGAQDVQVKNNINIKQDGQLVLEVGTNGENALGNSQGVKVTGTVPTGSESKANADGGLSISTTTDGDIALSTGNLTGTGVTVDLGANNQFENVSISTENGNNGVYKATIGEGTNTIKLDYNNNLFGNGNSNAINNGAMNINNVFENSDLAVRERQMLDIYEGSIYAETTRAAYDSVKTYEDILRGMNTVTEVGKWTAFGAGVYAKNEYDRAGKDSEIETTGLLAGAEYGLNNDTTVGVAFAGANQDVDSITGTADGTTLYLGTYARKVVGNYKFTAGLGYQYGDYDADNRTGYASSSDSYNSNTVSAYVEGRYTFNLGDNLTFEPKLKLGYTYVDQDDVKDKYIEVSDANLSTFDTEVGADLIKSVALKDGKLDLVFGAAYVRAMGDTDNEFTGRFAKSNLDFDIKGAELSENTGKFDLSIEVTKDNGFFYNGGLNLNVGSDDYRNYGVNVGVGYKF